MKPRRRRVEFRIERDAWGLYIMVDFFPEIEKELFTRKAVEDPTTAPDKPDSEPDPDPKPDP